MLDERIDGPKAGVLATVMLEVNDPLGVLYWTEEVASMGPEELRQVASQAPPSGDDPSPGRDRRGGLLRLTTEQATSVNRTLQNVRSE
ncbi:MAG: hypothetical protein F4X17_19890 [Gemmatimonadetes bacterium]|nr:hypothetical protein [Gemmatimonadota bacterium]